jgi:hypothetical protein
VRNSAALATALALLLAGGACTTTPGAATDPGAAATATCDPQASDWPGYCGYPADVRAFVDQRDACDHWRGEPIPGPEDDPEQDRRKQVLAGIEASCTGTDQRLSELKAAYASDPKIMQLLDGYESDIEAGD